ncbi:MAG: hypothetical protein SH847_10850 [Roseiflexaceae bacterium]|nr:hypothetical protein [Roseiflexaceae bacterium]
MPQAYNLLRFHRVGFASTLRAKAARLWVRFPFAAGFSLRMDEPCYIPDSLINLHKPAMRASLFAAGFSLRMEECANGLFAKLLTPHIFSSPLHNNIPRY